MASSTLTFDILARDRASRTLRNVGDAADQSSHKAALFGAAMKKAALGVGLLAGAAAVFTFKVGASYVASLNQVQALTGSSDKAMRAAAKQLEANSGLYAKMGQTTGDAAAGLVELTKSGLSLNQALGAIQGTMTLAKAGELDVADASAITANALNAFHLSAKKAGDIANYLANAANISSADVADIAESFKYVAPVAASAGVSIQQVNAILAELANSGIKASQAGTSLRTFLLNLEAPTKEAAAALDNLGANIYNAAGQMKPISAIIGILDRKLKGLSESDRNAYLKSIFGKTGIAGAITILNGGTKALDQYTKGVERAGAASSLAESRSKGLAGSFAIMKASVTSAAQSLYRNLSPLVDKVIRPLALSMSRLASTSGPALAHALSNLGPQLNGLAPKFQGLGHDIMHNLAPALRSMDKGLRDSRGQYSGLTKAVVTATPPILRLASSVGGKAIPPLVRLNGVISRLQIPGMTREFASAAQGAGYLATALNALGHWLGVAGAAFMRFRATVRSSVAQAIASVRSLPGQAASAVGNLGGILYGAGQSLISGFVSGIASKIGDVKSTLGGLTHSLTSWKGPPAKDRRLLRPAGRDIMDGFLAGIADREMQVKSALEHVTNLVQTMGTKISGLVSKRSGFLGTFSPDSIFGMDLSTTTTDAAGNDVTTAGTIADAIRAQQAQAAQAAQILHDVRQVTSMGLSKAMVRQLQSEGTSGAATLHALAQGNKSQIRQLNTLDKQTSDSLRSAGLRAGNYVRGGSINDDIARARRQDHILEQLEHHLKDLVEGQKKGQTIIVKIGDDAIIKAIHRYDHRKGKKTTSSP